MKALYLFITTEAEEPQAVSQFIAGYESNGATWAGTIDVLENFADADFDEDFIRAKKADGYDLFLRNTVTGVTYTTNYGICKDLGMLYVVPSGANSRVFIQGFQKKGANLICGAGTSEYGNATSYPCMFYDAAPYEADGFEINDIRQCGTVYNITHIQRTSSTRIGVMLDGVTDTDSIGLHTHGTPVYFASLSGSDISPLPTGLKYVTFSGNGNFFYIDHTTTSGTINAGFGVGNYQAVSAGTMTYGDTDSSQALVRYESYLALFPGQGLTFSGVGGFDNNPNGLNASTWWSEVSGWGDIFKIQHTLGSGSYAGGARLYYITQSYSTPYIAGKLTDIKLNLGCSWAEAIGRALVTASEDNSFDTYNGYGIIDVLSAISIPNRSIVLDAPVITSTKITASSYIIEWDIIPNVDIYEVFFRGEKVDEVPAMRTNYLFGGARLTRSKRNFIKVRAKRGETYSEFSNVIEIGYYKNLSILAGAIGNNPFYGYGYNYGANYGT